MSEQKIENAKKKSQSSDLFQLLLSVAVTGVFCLVEGWLVFYYNGGYVFPLIFGVLIILMICLHTINMYQFICKRTSRYSEDGDKKAEFLIYKQVKELPGVLAQEMNSVKADMSQELKTVKTDMEQTQLKVSKFVVRKTEETISGYVDSLSNRIEDLVIENEELKEKVAKLEKDHKQIFELLGSLAFRNDEINNNMNQLLSEVATAEEEMAEEFAMEDLLAAATMTEDVAKAFMVEEEEAPTEEVMADIPEVEEESVEDVFSIDDIMEPAVEEAVPEMMAAEEAAVADVLPMADATYDPNKQLSADEIAALFANL